MLFSLYAISDASIHTSSDNTQLVMQQVQTLLLSLQKKNVKSTSTSESFDFFQNINQNIFAIILVLSVLSFAVILMDAKLNVATFVCTSINTKR